MFPFTIADFTETVMVSSPFVHFQVKKKSQAYSKSNILLSKWDIY